MVVKMLVVPVVVVVKTFLTTTFLFSLQQRSCPPGGRWSQGGRRGRPRSDLAGTRTTRTPSEFAFASKIWTSPNLLWARGKRRHWQRRWCWEGDIQQGLPRPKAFGRIWEVVVKEMWLIEYSNVLGFFYRSEIGPAKKATTMVGRLCRAPFRPWKSKLLFLSNPRICRNW